MKLSDEEITALVATIYDCETYVPEPHKYNVPWWHHHAAVAPIVRDLGWNETHTSSLGCNQFDTGVVQVTADQVATACAMVLAVNRVSRKRIIVAAVAKRMAP